MSNTYNTHFLVPTNFGKASRIAQRAALSWGAGCGATVTLLHVLPPSPIDLPGIDAMTMLHCTGEQVDLDRRRMHLAQLSQELHPELRQFVELQTVCRQGELVEQIVQFTQEESIDAIVLGGSRWRWPFHASLGQKLMRLCTCQVITVHEPFYKSGLGKPGRARMYASSLLCACGWPRVKEEMVRLEARQD